MEVSTFLETTRVGCPEVVFENAIEADLLTSTQDKLDAFEVEESLHTAAEIKCQIL